MFLASNFIYTNTIKINLKKMHSQKKFEEKYSTSQDKILSFAHHRSHFYVRMAHSELQSRMVSIDLP